MPDFNKYVSRHGEFGVQALIEQLERVPAGGYSQSKWVAEQIVRKAISAGFPAAIYRLGEVGHSTQTGIGNDSALHHLLLQACIKLRA